MKIERLYLAGNGTVSFGAGTNEVRGLELITVSYLNEKKEVGENLLSFGREIENDVSVIAFKNLESFYVFKKMVDAVENKLIERHGTPAGGTGV